MKTLIFLVFCLAICLGETNQTTASCTTYDSTTNSSMQEVQNGTQIQNVFAKCPPGKVPGPPPKNNTAKASRAKESPPPPPPGNNTNNNTGPSPPTNNTNNNPPNNTNPPSNNTNPPSNNTNPPGNNTNPPGNNTNPPGNNTNNNPQPPPVNKTNQMGCQDPVQNGGSCQNPMMCKSGICIFGVCSAPAISGQCQSEGDTLDGYFCKKGTVTKCYQMNETCYGDSIMECYHGACNKATMKCDTFVNAVKNDTTKPSLIGGDSTGFKTCTVATVDQDCVYNTKNGSKSASQLGFSCMATKYAPTVQYFCQMGGGEPTFLELAKAVIFSLINF